MKLRFLLIALFGCWSCARPVQHVAPAVEHSARIPRLIVQVTVDQLRADLLTRYAARFGEGGLRRFIDEGVRYESASYAHAITETAPGHATLFTGALPSAHGIVGNEWFDGSKVRTSVEDPNYTWVERPTPERAGTAPTAMRATTWGDELILATGGRALVYGVSLKDRGAILPAGHAGKAVWYDEGSGDFVTSSYYYEALPAWLHAFQRRNAADRYPERWDLLHPAESYQQSDGRERFPHPLGERGSEAFYRALKHTPFGDELTLDVVEALLEAEPLGRDMIPDLLAVSFSATDAVGHTFGPDSLEAEDNLLRLDRAMARLFEMLLRRVPASELVVVLSADHGICPTPARLEALHVPGGKHPPGRVLVEELNAQLSARFGADSAFVARFVNPTFWLDEEKIASSGLAVREVEEAVAALLLARPGFLRAITRTDLLRGNLPEDAFTERARRSYDPERSGHVYAVPAAGWLLANDPSKLASMHGTPHAYDRAVALAFWGAGLSPRRVYRPVDPRDIAATMAVWLSIVPPSASSGHVLNEVVGAP